MKRSKLGVSLYYMMNMNIRILKKIFQDKSRIVWL